MTSARRRAGWRRPLAAAVAALLLPLAAATAPATADPVGHGVVASAVPASTTPQILDGKTHAIAQSGPWIYVGGTFTTAQDPAGGATLSTPYLLRFDQATGVIDRTFAPALDNTVNAIAPTADGSAVFVGGTFKSAGAAKVRNLVKLDATTGAVASGFTKPVPNGSVLDLALTGRRLIVSGAFSKFNGEPRGGLASLNATTGALQDYLTIGVAEHHNWTAGANGAKAPVGVAKVAVSPDGSRMVAIGNFQKVDGYARDQVVLIRLGDSAARVDTGWRTLRYTPDCQRKAFDYYLRDVDFSPDGSYFVVAASGSGFKGTLCDAASRFDVAPGGQQVEPTWTAWTGQDSLLSVAVTDTAVYVGGHQKWLNAVQSGADRQAGQVPRPGIAALDPVSGLPLAWNPGRHPRGIGAEELLATDDGIYVGSDTSYIGRSQYRRERIAFFPVQGGAAPVSQPAATLPRDLYQLNGSTITARTFTGTTATAPAALPGANNPSAASFRGAFMIGDKLVHGSTDNRLHYRTFTGTTFGADVPIDPYNDPTWSDVSVGGATTSYRGMAPTFYASMSQLAAMTYADGRIYYTKTLDRNVYWRWFSPDSLVVGAQEHTLTGAATPALRYPVNLFYAGGRLYAGMSTTDEQGELWRLPLTGTKVGGSWSRVTGSGISGTRWSTGQIFVGP
ncbi:hypothetical protein [Nocardioides sp. YIM 152588]|uniref:hypothetical protein n=1 Tax=Nocardioides sp. YIM 152588 TaxID=3158259 RepID=UPI0032E3F474